MRWSTTLGTLARREAVLVSCLAAATAIALLAGPLGAAWLLIAGAIIAAAGALVRVVVAVQRARLEGKREQADSRRLRVAVAPIGEIDPTLIGVDPAAQTILAGDVLPKYVRRTADDTLRETVAAALDGSGRWLVVVYGGAKVGKSRTLFEALHHCARLGVLEFVAPVDGDALRSLLEPGQSLKQRAARAGCGWTISSRSSTRE